MRARTARLLAALTVAFVIADVAVLAAYETVPSESAIAVHGFPFTQLAVIGAGLLGAVILSRYERHAVGALLSLVGLLASFSLLTEAYHVWTVDEGGPGPADLVGFTGWLSSLTGGQLAFAALAVMFLVAPDGRFLSARWRWVAAVIALGLLICSLALVSLDPTTFNLRNADIGAVRGPAFSIGFFMIAGGLLASLASMWIRFRRSRGEERRQLLLIALAAGALVAGLANNLVVQSLNGGEQTYAAALPLLTAYVLLPVLFGLAALRYRLYDIEVVINRTVVLAVGFAFAAVGYTTVVVLVGRVVDTRTGGWGLSLLATAVVALAFQPLRRGVIRVANRVAYGARAEPYHALSDFSRRLSDLPTTAELLPSVAEAAGLAVAARRATVSCRVVGDEAVWTGTWQGDPAEALTPYVVPIRSGSQLLGTIRVDVHDARPLRPADERMLAVLADQAAVAFRNTAIESQLARQVAELDRATKELAESRARILEADVVARRELETAISRDVLPLLAPLPERLREARAAVEERADSNGLEALVADTNAALEELRELTRGVFPTQLARVGIEPTLRSHLTRCDPAPTLVVDASAESRRFSERVENAVYFCCVEAARLGAATMRLSVAGDELALNVGGLACTLSGLRPVLDRVEAVGGSLSVAGDALELRIPVDQARAADQVSESRSGASAALATYAAAPDPATSN